jgi:hypothetical protein
MGTFTSSITSTNLAVTLVLIWAQSQARAITVALVPRWTIALAEAVATTCALAVALALAFALTWALH